MDHFTNKLAYAYIIVDAKGRRAAVFTDTEWSQEHKDSYKKSGKTVYCGKKQPNQNLDDVIENVIRNPTVVIH